MWVLYLLRVPYGINFGFFVYTYIHACNISFFVGMFGCHIVIIYHVCICCMHACMYVYMYACMHVVIH